MELKPGLTLHSVVDPTQVVVVRAPRDPVTVTCGGHEMSTSRSDPTATVVAGQDSGTAIGKRYADEALGLELLCSKPGQGTLAVDGTALEVKAAKALPSSD